MLVGNSLPEYVFIRVNIFVLRSIAPLSIIYTLITILGIATEQHRLPLPLEIYTFLEATFFLAVYLPLRVWLQYAASHPEALSRDKRQLLFQRMMETVSDGDRYLSGWFLRTQAKEIQRNSLCEFLAWSMMNGHIEELHPAELDEINGYVDGLEEKLGQKLPTGGGETLSLRTTFDRVPMQHRPLVWYLIVCIVDCATHATFAFNSFQFYRTSIPSTLAIFPPRPLALLGRSQPASARLSYWYRKHTSRKKLPIVFLQGIGIGLYPYVDFVNQMRSRDKSDDDGNVGIVVIEILPISSRICPLALTTDEMAIQLKQILDAHKWKDFVLVGHSYGTAIASTILQNPALAPRVKAAVLMDPICFLLHLPDVAYNFTRRKPRLANERMLDYFSSQDMLISHTLARRFFWTDYLLWKDDLAANITSLVTLSAKDLIVPTAEVWAYLTGFADSESSNVKQLGSTVKWKDGKREVLWFKDLDHAGLFNSKGARRGVARTIRRLCSRDMSTT